MRPNPRHEVGWGRMLEVGTSTTDYSQVFEWGQLEGSVCAELPPVALDRYFVDPGGRSFEAKTGKAICARCVVLDECRENALNAPNLPATGVVGGVTMNAIRRARAWRNYELGNRAVPGAPPFDRPDWLARPEGAETAEQTWLEAEEGVEL